MTEQPSNSDGNSSDDTFAERKSWKWSRPPRTTPPIIDRRVLPSGEVEEWERNPTIPDDFIYDPEEHAYYPPGEPVDWDLPGEMRKFAEMMAERRARGETVGGILTWAELQAAGMGKKNKKQRKKSRGEESGLLFDPSDDEAPATPEPDADSSE